MTSVSFMEVVGHDLLDLIERNAQEHPEFKEKICERLGLMPIEHDTCPVLQRAERAWYRKYERPGRHEYNHGDIIDIRMVGEQPSGRKFNITGKYKVVSIDDNTGELLLDAIDMPMISFGSVVGEE